MSDAAPAEEAPPPPPPPPTLAEWWATAEPTATKLRDEITSATDAKTWLQTYYSLATVTAPVDEQAAAMFTAIGRGAKLVVAAVQDGMGAKDALTTRGIDLLARWTRDIESGEPPDVSALVTPILPGPPTDELKDNWIALVTAVQAYTVESRDPAASEEDLAAHDEKIAAATEALRSTIAEIAATYREGALALEEALEVNKPKPEPAEAAPAEAADPAPAEAAASA